MSARRAALVAAVVLGVALVVVAAVATPWVVLPDPPGGPTPLDPGAGLPGAEIRRAEEFAALLRPASLISIALGLGTAAALGLTRLGARLVTRVAAPFGGGWVAQVFLGVGALSVLGRLVTLPVSAYAEMVRHRYGLSTRGWWLWLRDVTVATAISAVVTALALWSFLWLVRRAPRTWWVWCAGVAAGFVVVGSFLYPVVFEPAFNRFDPLPAGELRTELLALAEESGVPVRDVLVSDASRRTTALNAYVSGLGATRRIVVYDTLLDDLPDGQIESIVAHELGHVVNRDVLTGTLLGALGAGGGDGAARVAAHLDPPAAAGGRATGPGDPRVVPLVLFLLAAGGLLATPLQNTVSRQVEARADLHALDLTRDPDSFVVMQRRLATTNLSNPDPPAVGSGSSAAIRPRAQRVAFAEDWTRADRP